MQMCKKCEKNEKCANHNHHLNPENNLWHDFCMYNTIVFIKIKKVNIMKKFLTFVLLMFTAFAVFAKKDDEAKADSVKKRIENKSFVFIAQSAIPLKGKFISLSPSFDVKISGDTVTAYLPYYGEAHTAIFASEENGIKFTSVRNKYKVQPKKNGWNISIKPDDIGYGVELNFDISKSGSVMLRVSDHRRDPITFRGYMKL
jgi:hypothetical protein